MDARDLEFWRGINPYDDLKWPVISSVAARPYPGKEKIIEHLSVQPVKWQESRKYLQKQGIKPAAKKERTILVRTAVKWLESMDIYKKRGILELFRVWRYY